MNKKIVISGWYGLGNIGDEAILQTMIDTFRKKYENCEITVLSFNPEYTIKIQHVNVVYQIPISGIKTWIKNILLLRWIKTLKAIKECDLFVMGGGGFLSDWQPEVPVGWLKQMKIAKFFDKETILYCIGAGPFLSEKGKKDTKYYIDNYVDKISVRDKTSLKNLKSLKIKKDVVLKNDPVFDLEIDIKNIKKEEIIGINFVELFRHKSFNSSEEKIDKYINSLKEIIFYINKKYPAYKIEFVSFYKTDTSFYKRYFNEFDIKIVEPVDYKELVYSMQRYRLFIGTRFHSLIFSLKTKTPVIAIVYHHKSLDLCQLYKIDYEIISDGTLPPLEDRDIDTYVMKKYIDKKLKRI